MIDKVKHWCSFVHSAKHDDVPHFSYAKFSYRNIHTTVVGNGHYRKVLKKERIIIIIIEFCEEIGLKKKKNFVKKLLVTKYYIAPKFNRC